MSVTPNYATDTVSLSGTSSSPRRWRAAPDTLAHAMAGFTAERVGAQKDVAAKLGVSISYVSSLLKGRKPLSSHQLNMLLDACDTSEDERSAFNAWGAREAGWKI